MFKTKLLAVLTTLGLVDKAKDKTLTPEEWTNIESAFLDKYGVDMASAMSENPQSSALSAERQAALDLINANTEAAASTATEATYNRTMLELKFARAGKFATLTAL